MARPTTHLGPRRGWVVIAGGENILTDRTLSYLHPLPLCVIDDPQVRHVLGDPRLRRIGPGLTFASLGILYKPLAVPDQFADVELIVEDAGAALPVTRDC
jgi:hypothetical protein